MFYLKRYLKPTECPLRLDIGKDSNEEGNRSDTTNIIFRSNKRTRV